MKLTLKISCDIFIKSKILKKKDIVSYEDKIIDKEPE